MKKLFCNQIVILANAAEVADVTDIIALDNALTLDTDGWALLAPFGEHKKERIADIGGQMTREKYIQIVDDASVDAVLANERGTNIFARLKNALVKRPIYRDHPDLKLLAPETVVAGNQKLVPLGVNEGCRKSGRGLEFRPMLAPSGATAVETDGCKYPSAVFLLKKTGVVRDGGWIEVRPFALASIGLTDRPNISGVDSLGNAKVNEPAAKQTEQEQKNDTMKQLLIGWLAAQGVVLANDAADQTVFDAFNKEMQTRSASITTLGNDKQTLTVTANSLTGDKTKLAQGAKLPTDLVSAANEILTLGNAKTERDTFLKKFIEARVDLIITQGKAPVADRTKEIDALVALGNDKLDAAITALDARPVKFQVSTQVQVERKAGADSVAAAREQVITLANSDPRYKDIVDFSTAFQKVLADHPALKEQLNAKPGKEQTTAATT